MANESIEKNLSDVIPFPVSGILLLFFFNDPRLDLILLVSAVFENLIKGRLERAPQAHFLLVCGQSAGPTTVCPDRTDSWRGLLLCVVTEFRANYCMSLLTT